MTGNRIYAVAVAAADIVGEPMTRLASKGRSQHLAMMRQRWCWLVRQATGLSQPKIGELINRDHSTVKFALDKVEKMFQNGSRARLQKELDTLKAVGEPPAELFNFDPPLDTETMSVGELRAAYVRQRRCYAEKLRLIDLALADLSGAVEGAKKMRAVWSSAA